MIATATERADFRHTIGPLLARAVDEIGRIPDPGTREAAAGGFVPRVLLDGPAELLAESLDIVAGAPRGLEVLAGMAVAAPTAVALGARARLEELDDPPPGLGALSVEQAWTMEADEPVAAVYLLCTRAGATGKQLLSFTIETPVSGGAVKDGFVTGTTEGTRVAGKLTGTLPEDVGVRSVDPVAAAEQVVAAAVQGAHTGLAPTEDGLAALMIFLRASGAADADAIVQALELGESLAERIDELDEEAWTVAIDELADGAGSWLAEQGFDADRVGAATFATGLMADFRVQYLGADLAGWNAADLDAFLLEWVPRTVTLDRDQTSVFPEAVADALAFLAATGRLPQRRADTLAARARRQRERFVTEMADTANAGPAKALVAAMNADGVDLGDADAVGAWLETFNDRPYDERDALLGPSLGSHAAPAGAPRTKQKARKAQRQAGRHNRRG